MPAIVSARGTLSESERYCPTCFSCSTQVLIGARNRYGLHRHQRLRNRHHQRLAIFATAELRLKHALGHGFAYACGEPFSAEPRAQNQSVTDDREIDGTSAFDRQPGERRRLLLFDSGVLFAQARAVLVGRIECTRSPLICAVNWRRRK